MKLEDLIRALLWGLILGGAAINAAAADKRAQGSESITLTDEKGEQAALYHIQGTFDVPAPLSQVWAVLTDYSALKGIVSSVQTSCIVKREGNTVLVNQVAQGRFLFMKKTISLLLKIEEEPESALRFTETSGRPFKVYYGSWALEDRHDSVQVKYHLYVSRADMAPPVIERRLFRNNALTLLKELRSEIIRRAEQQASSARKSPYLTPIIEASSTPVLE